MKTIKRISAFLTGFVLLLSCQKQLKSSGLTDEKFSVNWNTIQIPDNFFKVSIVPGVASNASSISNTQNFSSSTTPDPDNGDDPVILGRQLSNPYTIPNMQRACMQLYGTYDPVYVTHLYVRFKPANTEELATLIKDITLELQDYPMDYEVLQDGDFYQDQTLQPEDIGWLYASVPSEYIAPPGIEYEILQELFIPPNDDLLLESMAESIAGGATYEDTVMAAYRYIDRTDETAATLILPNRPPVPCEVDPCGANCPLPTPENPCGGGPGTPTPGTPYRDPKIPRGTITVQDQINCDIAATPLTNVPVRQARIVCKRWFKVWLGYTDDRGEFICSKKYKHKVKINLKTQNNHAKISKIRGIRLWQILFPIKKRTGTFDQGEMAHADYLFRKPNPTNGHDKDLPYWVATTTHNSVIESREYAEEAGTGLPPTNLNILITNWNVGDFRASGATPLWRKCHLANSELTFLQSFVQYFIIQSGIFTSSIGTIVNIVKNETDVIISYLASGGNYNCRLTSASIKETVYHELGHAAHFAQAGCDYWQTYRSAVAGEIALGNPATKPYGDGTETNAGVIGVGEMWGNHTGYIFTNRHYGNANAFGTTGGGVFNASMQGLFWPNQAGLNTYLNALEHHDPNLINDVHRWIPQGLCYDLIDARDDNSNPIFDNVAGYTSQQCFNALLPDVRTIPAFRDRLLQQNGNNQANQVNNLVDEYNY